MGIIFDERQDSRESVEEPETDVYEEEIDEETDDSVEIDNDEGIDLDGDQDEDVDTDADDDTNGAEEDSEESEGDELDEPEEESEEEQPEEDSEEIDQKDAEVDASTARYAELERQREMERAEHIKFENQVKDTLAKLGIKVDGDVKEALDRAAAETECITLEEYRAQRKEKEDGEAAQAALKRQRFEELTARDLAELRQSFPDLVNKGNIRDCFASFEDYVQFGRLRDSGVTPKNAYMAINGEKVREMQVKAAQAKTGGDGKRHITPVAPKKASGNNVSMSKETLAEWRDNFPELTDAEIRKLYKETL